jgi:hypothetical protein
MPGRITPKRICRIVTPADRAGAAEDDRRKTGDGRGTTGRGN